MTTYDEWKRAQGMDYDPDTKKVMGTRLTAKDGRTWLVVDVLPNRDIKVWHEHTGACLIWRGTIDDLSNWLNT